MTHKKQLVVVALALVPFVGCGGSMRPQPQAQDRPQSLRIDASGLWTGWMVSEAQPSLLVPLRANVSQGRAMGQVQKLTVAVEIDSPQCFALSSGIGEGTLTGDAIVLRIKLNDGGTLVLKGKDQTEEFVKGHLRDGTFEMTGECQGKGKLMLDKP